MISIATVAVDHEQHELGRFEINLRPWQGTEPDPQAMDWWSTQPEAWAAATKDPVEPTEAIRRFVGWVQPLPSPRAFVAHPVHFDGGYHQAIDDALGYAHLPGVMLQRGAGR